MSTDFTWLAVLTLLLAIPAAHADTVHGYRKRNGTYVAPHHRTHADGTLGNNYSTQGNVNPYTGSRGHVTHKRRREPLSG